MTGKQPSQIGQSLAKVSIFSGLPAETLARIQKRCSWRNYEPGEPIVDYLDISDDVYFIGMGEARVSIYSVDGKAVTFTDLGPGEMFGEYAAIDGARRSATIEAKNKVRSRLTVCSGLPPAIAGGACRGTGAAAPVCCQDKNPDHPGI